MFRYGHHVDGAGSVIQMETNNFTELVSFLFSLPTMMLMREPEFKADKASLDCFFYALKAEGPS